MDKKVESLTKKEIEEREEKAREFVEGADVFTLATAYRLINMQVGINMTNSNDIRTRYCRAMKKE